MRNAPVATTGHVVPRQVQEATDEIKMLQRRAAGDIVAIGQKLKLIKEHLAHGEFMPYIQRELGYTWDTAQNFMHVAERFGDKIGNIPIMPATALYALAEPKVSEELADAVVAQVAQGAIAPSARAVKAAIADAAPAKPESPPVEPVGEPEPPQPEPQGVVAAPDAVQPPVTTFARATKDAIAENRAVYVQLLPLVDELRVWVAASEQMYQYLKRADVRAAVYDSNLCETTTLRAILPRVERRMAETRRDMKELLDYADTFMPRDQYTEPVGEVVPVAGVAPEYWPHANLPGEATGADWDRARRTAAQWATVQRVLTETITRLRAECPLVFGDGKQHHGFANKAFLDMVKHIEEALSYNMAVPAVAEVRAERAGKRAS